MQQPITVVAQHKLLAILGASEAVHQLHQPLRKLQAPLAAAFMRTSAAYLWRRLDFICCHLLGVRHCEECRKFILASGARAPNPCVIATLRQSRAAPAAAPRVAKNPTSDATAPSEEPATDGGLQTQHVMRRSATVRQVRLTLCSARSPVAPLSVLGGRSPE